MELKPQPAAVTITPRFQLEDKGKTRKLVIEIHHSGKTWDLAFKVCTNPGRLYGVVTTELHTDVGRSFVWPGGYRLQLPTQIGRVSASASEKYYRENVTPELVNKCLEDVVKIILDGRDPSEESK